MPPAARLPGAACCSATTERCRAARCRAVRHRAPAWERRACGALCRAAAAADSHELPLASARAARAAEAARGRPSGGEVWAPAAVAAVAELERLLVLLPGPLRQTLDDHPQRGELLELVLDLGRVPFARFPNGEEAPLSAEVLTRSQLEQAVCACGEFGADNRAGVDRTLHRVSCIRNRAGLIVGLTARVGRSIAGSAELIRDIATEGQSILLLGRPGVGKTTAIRELARILADDVRRRVVIVDSSNEIGGDGDVPHPGVGGARRMMMYVPDAQHQVLIEAVENHMPEVIVVDEIGTELEAMAARTIAQRGVQLIATAHGHTLQNLVKNPSLVGLVGGVESVTLGDEEAKRRGGNKSVLERQGPPTFTVAVEMLAIGYWRVHLDVGAAVDALLSGSEPPTQIRRCAPDGAVVIESEEQALPAAAPPAAQAAFNVQRTKEPAAAAAAPAALRLYCHAIDSEAMARVISTLRLQQSVTLTAELEDADAVLALRSRVGKAGADDWLRFTARQRGVPLYAIKDDTLSQLVRALQTIVGVPVATKEEAAAMQTQTGGGSARSASAEDEVDALEECRLAVEQIVIPRGTPVELLPRAPHIRSAQEALVASYRLSTATAGSGSAARLRILPNYSV